MTGITPAVFLLSVIFLVGVITPPARACGYGTEGTFYNATPRRDTLPSVRPALFAPKRINVPSGRQSVADVMSMSVPEIISQVPVGTGFYFIGCPNCRGGAQESGVLEWRLGMGDKVQCRFCGMVFPNAKYPNNRQQVIKSPDGRVITYNYYVDSAGNDYYFNAHAWYERWEWIRKKAKDLALLWYATHDNAYGDRAAAIIGQFAHLFPDYPVRFDYPNSTARFFPANQKYPYEGLSWYRGAKWRRWAYDDIPDILLEVFDLLQSGYNWQRMQPYLGDSLPKRIVNDLLKMGYEFTTANPEAYSNKSPGMYNQMIRLGRVINEPAYVYEGVKRLRTFCNTRFFRDGWWCEGSSAYHAMAVRGLSEAIRSARGYTDPVTADVTERFSDLNLAKELPLYRLALKVTGESILPNKRRIPINDTWWYNTQDAEFDGQSKLWDGLGNALLTTGGAQPSALNINWSGNYSHNHYDNGSIILFAFGKELFSDIGYTHTKYRGWSRHTASHNTVLIDEKGQDEKSETLNGTGRLLHYDVANPHVKTILVDASPAYREAKKYQRRLVYVQVAPGFDYVVDMFEVEGGKRHDYFLHGSADVEDDLKVEGSGNGQPVATLKPEWGGTRFPKEQHDLDLEGKTYHPYIHFSNIRSYPFKDQVRFNFQYRDTGVQVFHFLKGAHVLYSFRAPSIRQAKENENDLDKFFRRSIMIRSDQSKSRFLSVYAPYARKKWLQNVSVRDSLVIVQYQVAGKSFSDTILLGVHRVQVAAASGNNYDSGTPDKTGVEKMIAENGNYSVFTTAPVEVPVKWIRLVFPDGSSQYQQVKKIAGNQVFLKQDPGFTYNSDHSIVFRTFPQRKLEGAIDVYYYK